jgi:hypothetical protein
MYTVRAAGLDTSLCLKRTVCTLGGRAGSYRIVKLRRRVARNLLAALALPPRCRTGLADCRYSGPGAPPYRPRRRAARLGWQAEVEREPSGAQPAASSWPLGSHPECAIAAISPTLPRRPFRIKLQAAANRLFFRIACTPQLPSTIWVMPKSTPTDISEIASSSERP